MIRPHLPAVLLYLGRTSGLFDLLSLSAPHLSRGIFSDSVFPRANLQALLGHCWGTAVSVVSVTLSIQAVFWLDCGFFFFCFAYSLEDVLVVF